MSIDQRLSRLAPNLTAQERAILILEAWKEGRQEDLSWRHSMPAEQTEAFNRYIDLMNKTNLFLGCVTTLLLQYAEKIEIREGWLLSVVLWQDHVDEIRQAIKQEVKSPAARQRLESALKWTPAVDDEVLPEMPGTFIESLKEHTAYRLIVAWVEMECIEALTQEIGESFNGIDPLRPVFREKLALARQKLLATQEKLLELLGVDVVLREPLEEELEELREWFASLPSG